VRRAESGLEIIRGEISADTASFNLLLGLPSDAPTLLGAPGRNPEWEESLPELQTRALASQPEIQSRQHAALAAGYAAERAHLEPRPDIAVGPMIGTDTGATFAGAAVALRLPLWNRNRGGVAAAAAGRDEAEALVDAARLSVERLVANSYGLYRAARAQQTLYEQGLLAQTAELVETARKSYEGGESGLLDYLDARRTALAVRKEYYRASLDAVVTALRLRRAVGDDSEGAP
jgi:cobalt-zinc-cadmium efflux system outer membrane protein